jgi:lysophospholipase L1-like esterase/pimeloyl-ACP methyl ester carboxylesterase
VKGGLGLVFALIFNAILLSNAGAKISSGSKELGAIWFIGDSITQSNADGDANGSPRKALYDLLVAGGYTFTYTGHFTANTDGLPTTGSTAADNLYHYHSGISASVIGDNYDTRTGMTQNMTNFWNSGRLALVKPNVILIMLGANDVNLPLDLPGAPERLRTLIQTIYDLPDVGDPTIFLAKTTPNRSDDPQDSTNVAAFNAAVPGVVGGFIAQGRDVRIVDQFTPINDTYATNMRPDDLHPNAAGNAVMAQQWYNAITEKWSGTLTDFNSYDKYSFETNGLNCLVTVPHEVAEGKPWVWRARFPGQVPELDIALLSNGFHVAYVGVAGLFGSPEAVARFDAFYEFLTQTYGFNRRAALVGMSRGGLIVFNWARDNTDKVHCIYADAPVCDFKSWPGGFGTSDGNADQWTNCLTAYGFTEAEALAYEGNPVDNMEYLAAAGIPLLHVVGDLDTTVPFSENTGVIETNYVALGGAIKVIHKPGVAHKHEIDNPTSTIVNFILNAVSAADHVPTLMSGASVSNGTFNVQFSGTTGQHYRVEYTNDLTSGNSWMVTTDVVSLVESPMDISIPPTNTVGFYRIGWLPWE